MVHSVLKINNSQYSCDLLINKDAYNYLKNGDKTVDKGSIVCTFESGDIRTIKTLIVLERTHLNVDVNGEFIYQAWIDKGCVILKEPDPQNGDEVISWVINEN